MKHSILFPNKFCVKFITQKVLMRVVGSKSLRPLSDQLNQELASSAVICTSLVACVNFRIDLIKILSLMFKALHGLASQLFV